MHMVYLYTKYIFIYVQQLALQQAGMFSDLYPV